MAHDTRSDRLKHLDRKVGQQRALMVFENLWAAWARPLVVIGIGVIALASGVLGVFPWWLRLAVLAGLVLTLLVSLLPLFRMPRVRKLQVLRKLEAASAVDHRGLSEAGDSLAPELMDPRADSLWEEHKRRQLAALSKVRLVPPQSRWRMFDPYALRVPVALGLVAALLLGQGSLRQNLVEATRIGTPVPAIPLALDAWLKPPAYTGRPPLLLTSAVIRDKLAAGGSIEVPENAEFSMRLSGVDGARVSFLAPDTGVALTDIVVKQEEKAGSLTASAKLTRPLTIVVSDGARELGRWPISLIPDQPPTILMTEEAKGDGKGNLTLSWIARDDYGLRKLTGELDLADEQAGGTGFESNGIFLFDPPEMKFSLKRANAKEEKGTSRFDLAKHPWAGFNVTLNLTISDGADQQGTLAPVTFKLPERVFVRALPRALIEQRKQLILFPERAGHVGKLLDTVNLYPKGLYEGHTPTIMMGAIASRLRNASGYADLHKAIDDLWNLAVALEDGSLSDLRAELKALKAELEKALREGAPQERIAELMDKMREAMNKYLDAMREEAERRAAEGGPQPQQPGQEGKSISREELERMLKDLEDMSKGGNNEMAQQLLDQLDQLLQNLEPNGQQQAGEGDGNMDDMMQGLGDMMKKQQRLMDETQRMGESQPGEGQPGAGQQGEGQQGEGLAGRQQQLRDQLRGLKGQGGGNQSLDDAERAMGEAEQSLRQGDREGALQKQGEALDKLRKGARDMAEQMREQGQGQQGGQARDGEGRGGKDDPLGRPRASRSAEDGPEEDILPTEQQRARAREILDSLRAKANDRGLTDQERAYIDRLLRGLY